MAEDVGATKEFAGSHVQTLSSLPVKAQKCPFCQQALEASAAARLTHLSEFVTSTAQQDVRNAEADNTSLGDSASGVQIQRPDIDAVIAEMSADDATMALQISRYIAAATAVQERVAKMSERSEEPLIATTPDSQLSTSIRTMAADLLARAQELESSATSLSAAEQKELTEFESRVALRDNLDIVLAEIDRKRRLGAYAQCLEDTNTLPVTKKSTELTKALITDLYPGRHSDPS